MVVKIRLQRFGIKKYPFYHIVVCNARTARQSKPIEKLGTYDPIPREDGTKNMEINFLRTKYWLGVGAQPTDVVYKLLEKISLLPPKPRLRDKEKKDV
ncbi:ribosomal protein S16 [Pneumocystis carinii B80]|uniref:Ribosomal protein S16 n=1 Tax=Pneumocystis carinii (strain B80) TaxID=1408658 RepID=A0A0W4ZH81_PNEC8|nr:ribosomal protein S16 [Pneumocystis carinii B80]KTW27730.1 ribosomal protein S16 [Pneumocystis carinii B80]